MAASKTPGLERARIEEAIRAADGNISIAARELGASRRTLQNRMREYGMPTGQPGRRKRRLPYRRKIRFANVLGGAAVVGALIFGANKLRGSST